MRPTHRQAWLTVLILFLLSTLGWMDRSVIAMVIGAIKDTFHIGDARVSLLAGFAFVFFYVLLLIPVGRLADRHSRKLILFAGVLTWSLGTFFCGIAGSYPLLFASRNMVGAGESTISPVAASIIGSVFGRSNLAVPMSVYSLGTSVGTAAGAVLAGYILRWGETHAGLQLPLLGHVQPWQLVFLTLGLPGVLAAFLAFLLLDPRTARRASADGRSAGAGMEGADGSSGSRRPGFNGSAWAFMLANRGTFTYLIVGFVLVNLAVTSVMTWSPEYLRRAFGTPPSRIGWSMAVISVTAPLLCQVGVGWVVDRSTRRGIVDAPLRVMRWLLLPAAPLGLLLWLAPSEPLYLGAVFCLAAVLFPSNPLASSSIQMCAPENLRSELAAIQLAALGALGIGVGSSIVALLSQYVLGENRLNAALGMVVIVASLGSLALLSAGMRPMRATVAQAAAGGKW